MITNFENQTAPLTEDQLEALPFVMEIIDGAHAANPITAPDIILSFHTEYRMLGKTLVRLTEPMLRKLCNYARREGLHPVVATSAGYFMAENKEDLEKQIKSLEQRASAIQASADGLKKLLSEFK